MANMRVGGAADLLTAYARIRTPQRRKALLNLARELAAEDDRKSPLEDVAMSEVSRSRS